MTISDERTATRFGTAGGDGVRGRVALDVRPLTGRVGASIHGVRLGPDVDAAVLAAVRAALLRHRVVFLPGQELDDAAQVGFTRRLGDITLSHPTQHALDGQPHVHELDAGAGGRANFWHTDVTFTDRPPAISVLRALVVPDVGGDTVWANTVAAYDGLPGDVRRLADAARAVHTNLYDYGERVSEQPAAFKERLRQFRSVAYETEHPVVRVHPETGERALLLGGFATRLVGLGSADSAALLRLFSDQVTRPENTVRWRWSAGDVAIWDNRSTQHYAVNDYGDAPRLVRRVTVAGDVPVGLDGRVSVALSGDAAAYSPVVSAPVPAAGGTG
jgi:taurine dioxygenase